MKTAIPAMLLALLACASAGASPDQATVVIKCSANGVNCAREPVPPKAPEAPVLPPDRPGDARMGMMAAPAMMAPPSLAAPSMPPAPSMAPASSVAPASPVLAEIPASAHAACAGRKNGSKMTVKLGAKETMVGVCKKESGKIRFRMRQHRVG